MISQLYEDGTVLVCIPMRRRLATVLFILYRGLNKPYLYILESPANIGYFELGKIYTLESGSGKYTMISLVQGENLE